MTDTASSIASLARHVGASAANLPLQAAGIAAVPRPISGIKAVVFDFYDTLILTDQRPIPAGLPPSAILPVPVFLALKRAGAVFPGEATTLVKRVHAAIADEHVRRGAEDPGLVQPEIDIRAIWQRVLDLKGAPTADLEEAIAIWEAWTTRTCPAPGARELLAALRLRGLLLGIGSNAQFLAPALFHVHFGASPETMGFRLLTWSFRLGHAKPDPRFFADLGAQCAAHALSPAQVLFVGNDPARDIDPASQAGFATCLYAGDTRCLRPPGTATPDAVITRFSQLPALLP